MLEDVPQGFPAAVQILCEFPQDLFAELINEVIDFISYKLGMVDIDSFNKRLLNAGGSFSLKQVQAAVNALTYTLRDIMLQEITPEQLIIELKSVGASVFSTKAVKVLSHVWGERRANVMSQMAGMKSRIFSIGRLCSFKWKLCLSVHSNKVKNLGRAFLATELSIADGTGFVTTHCLEMNIPEFKEFAKQLREISNIIGTI